MLKQKRLLISLFRYELRASPTIPLYGGLVLALAISTAPALSSMSLEPGTSVTLLRIATVASVSGLVSVLDDSAASSKEVLPVPWWTRQLVRAAIALILLVPAWSLYAGVLAGAVSPDTGTVPVADLAIEAAALVAVCYAFILFGLQRSAGANGSVIAAPGLAVVVVVLLSLPESSTFYSDPAAHDWESVKGRWRWLIIGALVACALQILLGQSSLRRKRRHRSTSESLLHMSSSVPRETQHR